MFKTKTAMLVCILAAPIFAQADGTTSLKKFYDDTNSISANFHQVVTDTKGQKIQDVVGVMQLKRPNKFRWDYKKPFEQQIVSDGAQVWLYDIELAQVTVRPFSKALNASPAALLAGGNHLDQNFNLVNLKRDDGLDWVSADPKDVDSGFSNISLGFKSNKLQEMDLVDSFGHLTKIVFTEFKANPRIDEKAFTFKPPKGVDVLGE